MMIFFDQLLFGRVSSESNPKEKGSSSDANPEGLAHPRDCIKVMLLQKNHHFEPPVKKKKNEKSN